MNIKEKGGGKENVAAFRGELRPPRSSATISAVTSIDGHKKIKKLIECDEERISRDASRLTKHNGVTPSGRSE